MKATVIASCFKLVVIMLTSLAMLANKPPINYKHANTIGNKGYIIEHKSTVNRGITPLICFFQTKYTRFSVDAKGNLKGIESRSGNKKFLANGQAAPLLQIRVAGKDYAPDEARWNKEKQQIILHYVQVDIEIPIIVTIKPTHITLEIGSILQLNKIDMILWGPYPTIIGKTIGELVGIVRDEKFAIGIQALNAKTQGGEPIADGWEDHRYKKADSAHDGLTSTDGPMLHFGTSAKSASFGSTLQMHCFDHERSEGIFPFLQKSKIARFVPKVPVKYPGETVVGSKIALFGCPVSDVLNVLESIELAEGLPHQVIGGEWVKRTPGYKLTYLCFQFGEETIDDFIKIAQKADIHKIYHNSPWATWGHFFPKPGMFPNGYNGLKKCIDKAHAAKLTVGAHTLSGFITEDDDYVTVSGGHPNLVRTNGPGSPYLTTDFYKHIYFGNCSLVTEIMTRCADIINRCGFDQWEFDGLESNAPMGLGGYGRGLMLETWRSALKPGLRDRILLGSSAMDNYAWHILYGGNWGEPWYASFRESMIDYRIACIRFQARNYLPRMLGQFVIKPGAQNIKAGDIEWLMALSIGYDAGFTLTFDKDGESYADGSPNSHKEWLTAPNMDEILATIKLWRSAQTAGAFPQKIKEVLQDHHRQFHLKENGANRWLLYEVKNGALALAIFLKAASKR